MIEFDCERDVEQLLPPVENDPNDTSASGFRTGDQKHRVIVCRHWLLGLCHNGPSCSYLHRLEKSRMPPCKHGNLCKIKNCPLKHVAEEEREECLFYKQGFCYNGPKCGRRHVKRTPEECPAEVAFDPVSMNLVAGGKKLKTAERNDNFKVTLCTHWLLNGSCPFNEDCHFAHGEDEINEGYQPNVEFLQDSDIFDPTAFKLDAPLELPYPMTARFAYFILQSPDLRSLAIARRRGVWAVPMRMVADMNAAFRVSEHVLLYMCVRPLRGLYAVVRMSEMIPTPAPGTHNSPMSPEFKIEWLRTLRVSLHTIAQLKLGMSGMFVGRSSSDGKFENKVGLDIMLIAFRKPEWDWEAEIQLAERNIRLIDPMKGGKGGMVGGGTSLGEYFNETGLPPYHLPDDQLFAPDWIERAGVAINERPGGKFGMPGPAAALPASVPDFYSGNLPGFVFNAIPPVIEEMLARKLLGLPFQMSDAASMIHPNVPLFIFDSVAQVLLGIFYTDSQAAMNMEPTAFTQWLGMGPGGGSPLPVQLRFRIALEVPPVPIADPELRMLLGPFVQTMGGSLGAQETKAVANMLNRRKVIMSGGIGGGSGGGMGAGAGGPGGGGGSAGPGSRMPFNRGAPGGPSGGGGGYYTPPFKYSSVVPIDIVSGNIFEVKKKLLGTNASTIMSIVDGLGSKQTIRIRMRGLGSGFYEGPQHLELPEPLHFNVSAENEQLLQQAVAQVQALVESARRELQQQSR